jgi:hypothetical protein
MIDLPSSVNRGTWAVFPIQSGAAMIIDRLLPEAVSDESANPSSEQVSIASVVMNLLKDVVIDTQPPRGNITEH